jgi:phosphate transport system permease protein
VIHLEKRSFFTKLKNEYLGSIFATFCGILIVLLTLVIIIFISSKGVATFITDKYPVFKFLFSSIWKPGSDTPDFGILFFITGSTFVSIGAVILSSPISIAVAIFMNLISPKLGTKVMQPAMELFVGIPSVVYGFVGIVVLVPLLKLCFGGVGFSLLAGIIVLAIMIFPTIASLSSDAIKTIPKTYIEASYGLGATRWQTIIRVIIPAAKTGIFTGIVLGLARAFGEALAVQMVIGNAEMIPKSLLSPMSTITSYLSMNMANTVSGEPWNNALWSMALLLLIISFLFIVIIRMIGKRGEQK